jgi:hypothetical protein
VKLAWGAHVSAEFRAKVIKIAKALSCDPSHLMAVMAFETGGTFNPAIKNAAGSGATGLIQFMPATALGMGTTVEELAAKTAEDQLDDVFRYFAHYAGRLNELSDVYMAVLYPLAIGLFDSTVIFQPGSKAFLMNRGLDIDHDGAVTKAEATAFVAKRLAEGLEMGHRFDMPDEVDTQPAAPVHEPDTQPAAPIDDRSTPLPQPTRQPMGAALALLPLVAQFIPQIMTLIKPGSQSTAKDAAVAQTILNTVVQAAGVVSNGPATAQSVGAAVDAMQADPALAKSVQTAVVTHPDVMPMLGIVEVGSGGIKQARDDSATMQNGPKSFWYNPAFWITCLLLAMPFMLLADVFYVHPQNYTDTNLKTQIVTGVLAVIMVVSGFWLGSSQGSQKKDDALASK